ncbi:hypothetical protein CBS147311_7118 [Penicillium roqueforti]|nr:hypothetical protein CBS147311_7118 [Penicillium roqueforti]
MVKYAMHTAYRWYCTLKSREGIDLPQLNDPNTQGEIDLFLGERFCRYANCPKDTPATSTNNLRKHYTDKHTDMKLASSGGRPTLQDEHDAVEFYIAIRDEYDANVAAIVQVKPELPRKADGTLHLTNMRKVSKELGGQVPCEPCKDANDRQGCCREANADRCDNFELFVTSAVEEDEEQDNEEGDEMEEGEEMEE